MKMCELSKKEREKKIDGEKTKYICKCGKEAVKEKHLCKPSKK
jgi:hypothetical protein